MDDISVSRATSTTPLTLAIDSPPVPLLARSRVKLDFSIDSYLRDCRRLTLEEINRHLPADTRHTAGLYEIMLDYPMRPAKALRPALCVAVCLASGGHLDAALPSAAAFELFHNALLVHDDIEDGSLLRRHGPTLHTTYGTPIAVNVGDAMLAIALEPLLDNVRALGLGPAFRILNLIKRMARESVEGQMLELDWIRERRWDIRDREYLRMVHKKTGWYSFVSPVLAGAIAAGSDPNQSDALGRFALSLGIAFQIQDDLLSLVGKPGNVGKDALGDLWEGKYTLPLLHTLRSLPQSEQGEALAILARPRPARDDARPTVTEPLSRIALLAKITAALPQLTTAESDLLTAALLGKEANVRDEKEVERLHELVVGRGGVSLAYARDVAARFARRAQRYFRTGFRRIPDSVHKQFLGSLVDFVIHRSS